MAHTSEEQLLRDRIAELERQVATLEQRPSVSNPSHQAANGDISSQPNSLSKLSVGQPAVLQTAGLEHLVAMATPVGGNEFFSSLVEHLAKAFGVRFALVSELVDGSDSKRIQTLAFWADGQLAAPVEYDLEGTPCRLVLDQGEYFCGSDVAKHFPNDQLLRDLGAASFYGVRFTDHDGTPLGKICILDIQPLRATPHFRSIMKLFAERAAHELERKRAHDDQLLMQKVLDDVADAMAFVQADASFTFANRRFCEAVGYSKSELLTMSVPDIDPLMPWEAWSAHWEEAHEKGFLAFESVHRRKDGTEYHCEMHVCAVGQQPNSFLVGTMRDITERHRAESALRESEERFRAIFESEPECVKLLDREGRLLDMNPAGLAMIEAESIEQVRHQCVYDLITEEDRAAYIADNEATFDGHRGVIQFAITGLQGTHRWMESYHVPLQNASGETTAVLAVSRDITERKQAEALLRTHNQVLAQVVHGNPLSEILRTITLAIEKRLPNAKASVLLLEGKQLRHGAAPSISREFCQQIDGVEIGSAVGSCGTAAYEKRRVIVEDILTDPLWQPYKDFATQAGLRACWSQPITTDAETVLGTFALYYAEPHSPTEEEIATVQAFVRLACVAMERRKTEEALQLRDSELAHVGRLAMLGEVMAELAHEINQPLYSITNFARACINETSKHEDFDRELLRTWLEKIQIACNRASGILARTTEFVGRDDQGRQQLEVHQLIQQTLELISWRVSRAKIEIDYEPPADSVSCIVNRIQIEQVLLNLFTNGCDAISASGTREGRLSVLIDTQPGSVEIVVEDNGTGIADEVRDRLFEPFVTTKGHGMGMGLAISKSIVEDHGGQLYTTQSPAGDTRFHINLPNECVTDRQS